MNKEKTRIGVLVSGGGTNLQALIDAEAAGVIHSGTIAAVISNNPDAYALKRAQNAGIKTFVIPRATPGDREVFERRLAETLDENGIELIVLAGFMCILSAQFTDARPGRIINVHPSLIPSFCGKGYYGLRVHEEALKRGVKVTGATVHFVNSIPDGGEIIFQKAVGVLPDDTPESLQLRVMREAEWKILPEAAEKVSESIQKEKNA